MDEYDESKEFKCLEMQRGGREGLALKNKSYLIKPQLNKEYKEVVYGYGIYLFDEDGKRYMDGSSGAVSASIGHGIKEVVEAMDDQAKKVSFVYRSQFTTEPSEQLARKISEWTPGDVNWSFFVNSGSEANETALKIAIQYWQEKGQPNKKKFISRWMSYHGITIGALSMSGHIKRRERFVDLLEDYPTISPPYCYRCPFKKKYPDCELACANELEQAINRMGPEHIAAFIAEPIVGAAGGAIVPPPGYYERIKQICDQYNILFIVDEVMTGIGRTGKKMAINHWNVVPDLITLGKGLSGGYTPIAATVVSDRIMEPIHKGSGSIMSGHTFSANPQSTATALAVMNYMEKHNLVKDTREKGRFLLNECKQLASKYSIVGNVRGKGLLIGLEFVSDFFQKIPFQKEIDVTSMVVDKAQQKGLLVYPASAGEDGDGGDAILIAPPLIITQEEMRQLMTILEETIREVQFDLQLDGYLHLSSDGGEVS